MCYVQKGKYRKAELVNGLKIEFNRHSVFKVYSACLILSEGGEISRLKGGEFLIKKGKSKIITREVLRFYDHEKNYHIVNYANKIVLDVGGYIGDTAVLFKEWGTTKVIIYEALQENIKYLKRNVRLNNIDAEIYPLAVCGKCGEIEIMVDEKSIGTGVFGLTKGGYKIKLKAISWDKVLKHATNEGVEIAKVDCEGCERFLLNANNRLIKKIPYWIIEVHSPNIKKELVRHFTNIGFNHKLLIRGDFLSTIFFYPRNKVTTS